MRKVADQTGLELELTVMRAVDKQLQKLPSYEARMRTLNHLTQATQEAATTPELVAEADSQLAFGENVEAGPNGNAG